MVFDGAGPPSGNSKEESEEGFDPFAGPSIVATVPSTGSQREIWLASKLGPDASCAFNESVSVEFHASLDPKAIRSALNALCERHESLRAMFSSDGETMCVVARCDVPLTIIHLAGDLSEHGGNSKGVEELLSSDANTPFDLQSAPLLRGILISTQEGTSVLCLTAHHIVVDGWSYGVLLKELASLYSSEITGDHSVLAAANQFTDFAKEERKREISPSCIADEEYWKNLFRELPQPLSLPGSGRRSADRSYNSRRLDARIEPAVVGPLKVWGASRGCSLFTSLFGAFSLLLYRLCGQSDIVIGIPTAGQAAAGTPALIGHCVNTLPVRIKVDGKNSVGGHLDEARRVILEALDHQRYTLGTLIRSIFIPREANRPTLVSVLFNFDRALPVSDLTFGSAACIALRSNPRAFENFEIFLSVVERDGGLDLECQYNTTLFTHEDIEFRIAEFIKILSSLPTHYAEQVARIEILPPSEIELLDSLGNGAIFPLDPDDTLIARIERNVREDGNKLALLCGRQARTFEQLWTRVRQVAATLRQQNCATGDRVAVFLDRSVEYIESVLGIVMAGGVYVPLDPLYPAERVSYILSDSGARVVVTSRELAELLPKLGLTTLFVGEFGESSNCLPIKVEPEDPLYLLYTSGTTGIPKGVLIPHRAAINFVSSIRKRPGLSSRDVCLSVTTPTFDIWFLETVTVLAMGGTVVVAEVRDVVDGGRLLDLVDAHSVTVMQATPYTWRLLLEAGWRTTRRSSRKLRILCGGEAMPVQLMHDLLDVSDDLWNMYGPTEATVWATCKHISADDVVPTIGAPFDNTELLVLDSDLQKVPVGAVGELFIGGSGVALGYYGNETLTNRSFVRNPYGEGRVYRTGDVVRFTSRGDLQCLGRTDYQIKIRGYRIEVEEIEAVLAQVGIASAVVKAWSKDQFESQLVLYLPYDGRSERTLLEIQRSLAAKLPQYMIPTHLERVPAIPLTPNGKVDRKRLPAPTENAGHSGASVLVEKEKTETEERIADVWRDLLGTGQIALNDSFFNRGGHSLLAMKMIARVEKLFGVSLNPRSVLMNTLGQLSAEIDKKLPLQDSVPATERSFWSKIKRSLQG